MQIYNSIDTLPVYLFDKINQTGDLKLLVITTYKGDLEKVWEKIYDEFIQEFGISENFLIYLTNMKIAINYYVEAYIKGDRAALNLARASVNDAEEIYKEDGIKDNNVYAMVSKFMGFRVNPKEISTREFYQYLRLANGKKD